MGVVKGAVGCAVVAVVAGHQLAALEPARREALWASARAAIGGTGDVPARPRGPVAVAAVPVSPTPQVPEASLAGTEVIAPDARGQFETTVEVEGQRLPVLIDTGATFVALSFEDADRLGLRPAPSEFRYAVDTANGRAAVARVSLSAVRLGGIEVRDVPALVAGRGQMSGSLLGMSFLSRLSGFRIDRGHLLLAR